MKPQLFVTLFVCFSSVLLHAQSGSLDSTFSEDGIDIWNLGSQSADISYAGALQPDGKTIAIGWTSNNGNLDYAIIRYMLDGSRDTSFGNNGLVLADYNNVTNRGQGVAVQPDGKIIVVGASEISSKYDYTTLRLKPDGTPDSTFGEHGWVNTDLGTDYEYPNAVAVQADGKIIVAGRLDSETFSDFGIIRLHADGQLDTLFGDKGIVTTSFREEDMAFDILIQPDGKIIVGGFSSVTAIGDFALARYNEDGTLDKLFGTGGKVLTDLEGFDQSDFINDMVLLDDGKILAAGNASNNNLDFTSDIGIVKYQANGDLDETFGNNGVVVHPIGGRTNVGGIAIQQDGKIVLCGESDALQNEYQWYITRYGVDGKLDSTFADNGIAPMPMPPPLSFPNGIFIQADSRIVLTGTTGSSPDWDFVAARFIADFTLAASVTDVSCFGVADGTITVEASGGVAPYMFSIDGINYQKSNIFTGLAPGSYTITIIDANGTGVTGAMGPIIIPELAAPPSVSVEILDTQVTITVADGGTPPFLYSNNGGIFFTSSNTFTATPDVPYAIVVIDDKGCVIFDSTIVVEISAITDLRNTLPVTFSPNPTSGKISLAINSTSGNDIQINLMDMTGRRLYTSTINDSGPTSRELDLSQFDNGSYVLWVFDQDRWAVKKLVISK